MGTRIVSKSLQEQKVRAYFKYIQENEKFWNSVLIFLGALFILSSIPFFLAYMVPVLALICAVPAYYEKPHFGTLAGIILAFLSVMYQSPVFGFVFLLVVAVTLFEMFEKWAVISALEIFIFAPFAPFPLSLLSGFVMLGMVITALHFGSKRSLLISIPSILIILLLSSIWMVPNSLYLPVNYGLYGPEEPMLMFSKPASTLYTFGTDLVNAVSSLFNFAYIAGFGTMLGKILNNLIILLFSDSGIIQLFIWAVCLYLVGFISGRIKGRAQIISSLVLVLIPVTYYFLSAAFGYPFSYEMVFYTAGTILIVGILENYNIKFSRESEIIRKEKAKKFGKFGLEDLSFGKGAKSLDDIGNYDDVKQELMDSILLPLESKELSYTYGLKPPSGILLFGPPGTGKTMLMRALSKELKYGFYYVKSSDILSQWYGESEKNISELFAEARKSSPCILFFDEIDALAKKRTEYSADDVGPRILSTLLQEIDGFKTGKPVLIVGATNVPDKLDPAILRPGRFDKIIYMHLPDYEGRKKIFEVALSKVPVLDIDTNKLAKRTQRFSGADIVNVVEEAKNIAAKEAAKAKKIIPI
ncbi:AAA family ATPase, partial [Candidatus Micrarchaeota archaeon]|nr:AAA family ATPase [Candidatus Micrarchaeota archaeon]